MCLRAVLACALSAPALLALPALPASAGGCALARSVWGRNPSYAEVSAAIDRAAARRKVPPTLLKAIAWRESGWQQFWSDGRAKVSYDCGVGIMQVTGGAWDYRRLAGDYVYNVEAGAQVLAAKMSASSANVPPSLGRDERRVFENWYRATYRYNGAGWSAERYADAVFGLVRYPPSGIRPWTPPVAVANPKNVVAGYRPTSAHGFVARLDGTWVSTLGTFRHPVRRADFLAHQARTTTGRRLEADQRAAAGFAVRNIGWETWSPDRVSLGTWPVGRRSRLEDARWASATRPAAVAAATPPGGVARFSFPVRAGRVAASLDAREEFVPLVDGWVPIASGRATGTWRLDPARAPTASVVSAPRYVTDAAVDATAPLRLAFADPAPGSGVSHVHVATRRSCDGCAWATVGRVSSPGVRVALAGSGRHEVRVRAVDRAGHAGAWSAPVAVVVPRDDAHPELAFAGSWTTEPAAGAWLGSVARGAAGASVETSFTGSAYAVIGARGPGLPPLAVYVDGELVAVVPATAETAAERQVLHEGTVVPGPHVVRVVVGGPPEGAEPVGPADAGPWASLDAIAVT